MSPYIPLFLPTFVEPSGFFLGPSADHIGNASPVDLKAGKINQDKTK